MSHSLKLYGQIPVIHNGYNVIIIFVDVIILKETHVAHDTEDVVTRKVLKSFVLLH